MSLLRLEWNKCDLGPIRVAQSFVNVLFDLEGPPGPLPPMGAVLVLLLMW